MITALVSLDPILILQDYVYTKVPHTVHFHNRALGRISLSNTVNKRASQEKYFDEQHCCISCCY